MAKFKKKMNRYAQARENLIKILSNRSQMNADIIKIQASALSKLTAATNQLTRISCVRCLQVKVFFLCTVKIGQCLDDGIQTMPSIGSSISLSNTENIERRC